MPWTEFPVGQSAAGGVGLGQGSRAGTDAPGLRLGGGCSSPGIGCRTLLLLTSERLSSIDQ